MKLFASVALLALSSCMSVPGSQSSSAGSQPAASPEHQFTMTVDDDGGGLSDADPARSHYGLTIMRERARSLGGTVTITPREGGGTRVQLRFAPQRFPSREPDNETSP